MMCKSSRKIDRHEFHCGKSNSHKIHTCLVMDEDDKEVFMEWDDRKSYISAITDTRLRFARNVRRLRAQNA